MDKVVGVTLRSRAFGALWGIFIADALSMPVHWFYNRNDIQRTFGYLSTYQPAPAVHPSSIMNLHSTGDGGRGGQSGSIVGDVILKGKKQYWGRPQMHYHQGMKAGMNTLNAHCARLLMRSLTAQPTYNAQAYYTAYAAFMTAEDSHPDTYAESYHRIFFSNHVKGKNLLECGGAGHDTPSVGAFVPIPILVVHALHQPKQFESDVRTHLAVTHPDDRLASYAALYATTLANLLSNQDPEQVLAQAAQSLGMNLKALLAMSDEAVVTKYGSACYITSSLPVVIFLAYKYRNDFQKGITQNTNLGGENCHRGSALAALLGAIGGMEAIPAVYITGLYDTNQLQAEIEGFVDTVAVVNPLFAKQDNKL